MQNARKKIDEIDARLIGLLAERFEITRQIGQYKAVHGLPARDHKREAKQFARIEKLAAQQNINPQLCRRLLEQIIDESVKLHQQIAKESQNDI